MTEEDSPRPVSPAEQDLHARILAFIVEKAAKTDEEGQAWQELLDRNPGAADTKEGVSAVAMNYADKVLLRDLASILLKHDVAELQKVLDYFDEDSKE